MVDISFVKTFVVVGAGTMGREIAQVALMAGYNLVILNDINQNVLDSAKSYIEKGLKKIESKGQLGDGLTTNMLMTRFICKLDLRKAVENADFIVEAIPEKMDLKQDLFEQLGKLSPKNTVLASNTSTMRITQIGERSGRPDKVVGMHYFIPIPIIQVIEVIKSKKTVNPQMLGFFNFFEILNSKF